MSESIFQRNMTPQLERGRVSRTASSPQWETSPRLCWRFFTATAGVSNMSAGFNYAGELVDQTGDGCQIISIRVSMGVD
jgi:hypothetical protein